MENKCGATLSYSASVRPSAVTHNSATGKSYTYDANGNMTARGNQTLAWDIENRVMSVSISGGNSTDMEYEYTGIRVKKNGPNGTFLFPFKGYEIDPSNTTTKYIKIGNETFAAKKRTSGGATTQLFYHNDHLGGVQVTDSGGNRCQLNEYEPWGAVSRSDVTNPACDATHRFTGQELDPETGLYYYGGRYYDQDVGRFASADPFVQAPDMPQNLNRYSYVLNNPQGYVDPSGYFVAEAGAAAMKLAGWARIIHDLADLLGIGDSKKIRRPAKQKNAPQPQNEVTNKNGPEPSKNVSVYETNAVFVGTPIEWRQFEWVLTAQAGNDYPDGDARIGDWLTNLGLPIDEVWRSLSTINGLQIGIQGGWIKGDDGGMNAKGLYFGRDGRGGLELGKYDTISTPYGGLNLFASFGVNVAVYRGQNPAGRINAFNIAIFGKGTINYDNRLYLDSISLGLKGPAAGIAWTSETTSVSCWYFCK